MLRSYVPDTQSRVRKASWRFSSCNTRYYGERYCLVCQTGEHSSHLLEVTVCG
ncbi:putative zinc ribbon protein [Serratia fonticola]|uniref:putative zinc ribbon protein n=1 Tax=Serratia fonticola TaxID=47917 RepID=UPI003F5CF0E3